MGRIPYAEGLALQSRLVSERREGTVGDTLLLLEHPPVITLGRGSKPEHVLVEPRELERRGIELHECGRGGDVTFHGPGQLVGYPIIALEEGRRDAHRYLRDLEEGLIRAAECLGVRATRVPGWTGIWVGREKLAAIGVRLSSGWITSHGFALNVATDLDGFSTIVPCGITEGGVTSLERLTGTEVPLARVAALVAHHLGEVFGRRARGGTDLDAALEHPVRSGGAGRP